jgi:hypothetical protein
LTRVRGTVDFGAVEVRRAARLYRRGRRAAISGRAFGVCRGRWLTYTGVPAGTRVAIACASPGRCAPISTDPLVTSSATAAATSANQQPASAWTVPSCSQPLLRDDVRLVEEPQPPCACSTSRVASR